MKRSAEETVRVNLLVTMRTAMQGGIPQAAVAAFMKWAPQSDEVCLPITKWISLPILITKFDIDNTDYAGLQLWFGLENE